MHRRWLMRVDSAGEVEPRAPDAMECPTGNALPANPCVDDVSPYIWSVARLSTTAACVAAAMHALVSSLTPPSASTQFLQRHGSCPTYRPPSPLITNRILVLNMTLQVQLLSLSVSVYKLPLVKFPIDIILLPATPRGSRSLLGVLSTVAT